MSVRVEASPEVLDIHIGGADRFFGLRGRLEIPTTRVIGAHVVPTNEAKSDLWIRTGGLGWSGLAAVGHFRGRQAKKQWWRVYRGEQVLVIDLTPESQFDRIVLELDDPEQVADQINTTLHNPDRPFPVPGVSAR